MITVIDYKAGNLTSVKLAFEHIGEEGRITDDPATVAKAQKVVFPGVGAAGSAMQTLHSLKMAIAIEEVINKGTPFLGICIGMQLLFESSQEDGQTKCLGFLPGEIKKFAAPDPSFKIPQMGWNAVSFTKEHPVFDNIETESEFYFVHSYYACVSDKKVSLAETDYAGVNFTSIAGCDNVIATQFHPERSGTIGLTFLKNFCKRSGQC